MLSNGFASNIHLRRRPSQLLAGYLTVIHLLALLALLVPLAVPPLVRAFGFGLVLLSGGYYSRRYHVHADSETEYWIWTANGSWRHTAEQGVFGMTRQGSVNTPWFVVLVLCEVAGQAKRRLLVFCDQLDAEDFRRLRVRLRFFHEEASARRVAPL